MGAQERRRATLICDAGIVVFEAVGYQRTPKRSVDQRLFGRPLGVLLEASWGTVSASPFNSSKKHDVHEIEGKPEITAGGQGWGKP